MRQRQFLISLVYSHELPEPLFLMSPHQGVNAHKTASMYSVLLACILCMHYIHLFQLSVMGFSHVTHFFSVCLFFHMSSQTHPLPSDVHASLLTYIPFVVQLSCISTTGKHPFPNCHIYIWSQHVSWLSQSQFNHSKYKCERTRDARMDTLKSNYFDLIHSLFGKDCGQIL